MTGTDAGGNQVSTTFAYDVTNPAPTANNLAFVLGFDATVTLNPLVNDVDPDGDQLTVLNVGPTTNGGTVAINPDGTLTYTPVVGFIGRDTFTYTIDDGNGGQDTATISIDIGSDSLEDPEATPIPAQNAVDNAPFTPIDLNDFIEDSFMQAVSFAVDGLPEGLALDANGVISGSPANDASENGPNNDGVYPVTITAVDTDGNVITTGVEFTVTNPEPEANNDIASTEIGEAVTISVLANDNDPDGDDLTVSEGTPPANGTILSLIHI